MIEEIVLAGKILCSKFVHRKTSYLCVWALNNYLLVLIDGAFTNEEKTYTAHKFIPAITLFLLFLTMILFSPCLF